MGQSATGLSRSELLEADDEGPTEEDYINDIPAQFDEHIELEAGLLTQEVPGVPPDPLAPRREPPWILSR